MMSFSIIDRSGVLNREVRDFAERRLLFALSRFDSKIQRVSAILEDTNGPRGGVVKAFRISVKLRRADDVTVTDQDSDAMACVARAAERVGRAVARSIERSNHFEHSRPVLAADV